MATNFSKLSDEQVRQDIQCLPPGLIKWFQSGATTRQVLKKPRAELQRFLQLLDDLDATLKAPAPSPSAVPASAPSILSLLTPAAPPDAIPSAPAAPEPPARLDDPSPDCQRCQHCHLNVAKVTIRKEDVAYFHGTDRKIRELGYSGHEYLCFSCAAKMNDDGNSEDYWFELFPAQQDQVAPPKTPDMFYYPCDDCKQNFGHILIQDMTNYCYRRKLLSIPCQATMPFNSKRVCTACALKIQPLLDTDWQPLPPDVAIPEGWTPTIANDLPF